MMAAPLTQAPELNDHDYFQWKGLIEERLGCQFPDSRRSFLKTCLAMRMREAGFDSYGHYYEFVSHGEEGFIEWNSLIDWLTVQETRFFRDPDAFSLVRDHLRHRIRQNSSPLSLWSVGCSTGEEAYSLAILVEELIRKSDQQSSLLYGVTGSDVSRQALADASSGFFQARRLELVDKRLHSTYFQPARNGYRVNENVRDRVCFVRINLVDIDLAPLGNFDVVYCQNVLIYFPKWRRKDIVSQLADRLSSGGMLVLGLGEMVDWQPPGLTKVPSDRTLAYIKN